MFKKKLILDSNEPTNVQRFLKKETVLTIIHLK